MTDEYEEIAAPDGNTYRVLKNPPPPTPPLEVSDKEKEAIDSAIVNMCQRYRRERISVSSPRFVNDDEFACDAIDRVISDTLNDLKPIVSEDTAEKLFERLGSIDDWGNDSLQVGIFFIRFFNTMEAMVSFKGKFRGKELRYTKYSKEEAQDIFKERGLTRRR